MAVEFSAGNSGYMRSDFMISDAAIPQRTENALNDSEKFSTVLSESGKQKSSVTTIDDSKKTADVTEKFTASDGKVDCKAMAKAVAKGELKLEDIPEEFIQEVAAELMQLFADTDFSDMDIVDESEEELPEVGQVSPEAAAMMTQPQTVHTDDKTEELSILTAAPVEKVAESSEIPEQTMPVQTVEEPKPEAVVAEENTAAEISELPEVTQAAAQEVQTDNQVFQTKTEQPEQNVVQPEAEVQTAPVEDSGKASQQSFSGNQEETQQDSDFTKDITHFETKSAEKQPEEEPDIPVFADQTLQRSRVVSKSDELDIIKSSNGSTDKTTDDSMAQSLLQPDILSNEPVAIPRADGSEVMVKPADVAQQVAEKLVERTEELPEGNTEYTMTLTPEDLGRITVKMTKAADGTVSVSIAAENSRTLRILEDHGAAIQDSLKQNGVQLENWQTVSESQQETRSQDYQGSSKNPYREAEHQNQEDEDGESFADIIASM